MEEIEKNATFTMKEFFSADKLIEWYHEFKTKIKSFEDIKKDHLFASRLILKLPPIIRRPEDFTNEQGVEVDPEAVIREIELNLNRVLSPAFFEDVSITPSIKTNLFETHKIQSSGFGFSIDWRTPDLIFPSLIAWAEKEIDEKREIYLVLLVLSYVYHAKLYEENGVHSLVEFWTLYSPERRQGGNWDNEEKLEWTIRPAFFWNQIQVGHEPEEGEEIFFPGLPPPPAIRPKRVLGSRIESKKLIASLWNFQRFRSENHGDERLFSFSTEKDDLVRQMNRLTILVGDDEVNNEWYRAAKVAFAETFRSGITDGKVRSAEKEMRRMYSMFVKT